MNASSEHMCCVRVGRLAPEEVERREAIAKRHGGGFVYANIAGVGHQSWFTTRNYGEPFNTSFARAVAADLEAAEVES